MAGRYFPVDLCDCQLSECHSTQADEGLSLLRLVIEVNSKDRACTEYQLDSTDRFIETDLFHLDAIHEWYFRTMSYDWGFHSIREYKLNCVDRIGRIFSVSYLDKLDLSLAKFESLHPLEMARIRERVLLLAELMRTKVDDPFKFLRCTFILSEKSFKTVVGDVLAACGGELLHEHLNFWSPLEVREDCGG